MTPMQAIIRLERQLDLHGEPVTLVRFTLGPSGKIPTSVTLRGFVRRYAPGDILPGTGLVMGDSIVVLSPKSVETAQWPGQLPTNPKTEDPRIPQKDDTVVIAGRPTVVQGCEAIRLDGKLVRYNVHVRG